MSSPNTYSLRILFVDDEAGLRLVIKNELQKQGHEVTVAEDGAAAIQLLDDHHYDCAIVDLKMPNVDGWGVIEHLKKVAPDTDFIISTGHGNMPEVIKALHLGAFDFVPKPAKHSDRCKSDEFMPRDFGRSIIEVINRASQHLGSQR